MQRFPESQSQAQSHLDFLHSAWRNLFHHHPQLSSFQSSTPFSRTLQVGKDMHGAD